ncbi:superoxide dismutase family protein [Thalassobacillus sp. CUG 92003]|uniref:superoxide dismutase family protein n=1 Tax=Thalassobacillus sp. CUG 92003 TaxID=2736641 RepID=UPI0015E71B79|nr:superoxide dismutase family protein [Thalassobacillus sp. CUG 92003]
MRLLKYKVVIVCIIVLSGCQSPSRSPLDVGMYNPDGDMIGTATFKEASGGVEIALSAEGMDTGFHAVHIHEYPKCEGPDFKSAGNHLNPTGKEHGLLITDGPHLGDLPNVEAGYDGLINAELLLTEATLKDGQKSLLKDEGTSIIINQDADDGMSQPAGDSGDRIACGVIQLQQEKDKATDPTEPEKKEEEQS